MLLMDMVNFNRSILFRKIMFDCYIINFIIMYMATLIMVIIIEIIIIGTNSNSIEVNINQTFCENYQYLFILSL